MKKLRRAVLVSAALTSALALSAPAALADPGNGNGKGQTAGSTGSTDQPTVVVQKTVWCC